MRKPGKPKIASAGQVPALATQPAAPIVASAAQPTTTVEIPAAPLLPAEPRRQRQTRQARQVSQEPGLYDRVGQTAALIMALIMAFGLWFVGARFTLEFLASMGIVLASIGIAKWLIPLLVSAAELWLWPQGLGWQRWCIWSVVLIFDVGSSWAGFVVWASGRYVPLFQGFTLPTGGVWLHGIALALGLAFAFLPERLGRWAIGELQTVWG